MSEPEGFLRRWSRRKQDAAEAKTDADIGAAPEAAEPSNDAPPVGASPMIPQRAVDPADLPPVESIAAGSDIRAFLAEGVPTDLKTAALRRAWLADPAIRDFVGPADYAWDFNAPDAVAGFGPLRPTDDVARLAAQVFGGDAPKRAEKEAEASAAPASAAQPAEPGDAVETADTKISGPRSDESLNGPLAAELSAAKSTELAVTQDKASSDEKALLCQHRRHGGALPR